MTFDIDTLHDIDPKPFFRAVMSSPDEGADALEPHPINHRPLWLWRCSMSLIRHWFHTASQGMPSRRRREGLVDLFANDHPDFERDQGFDFLPIVAMYIETTFDPDGAGPALAKIPMDPLCTTALFIPSTITARYPWREGEREALVVAMSICDPLIDEGLR